MLTEKVQLLCVILNQGETLFIFQLYFTTTPRFTDVRIEVYNAFPGQNQSPFCVLVTEHFLIRLQHSLCLSEFQLSRFVES